MVTISVEIPFGGMRFMSQGPVPRELFRCLAVAAACLVVATGLVAAQPAAPASAIVRMEPPDTNNVYAKDFNPGNIISDANFYNGSAMTAPTVQTFLDAQGVDCTGTLCLKSYRQATVDIPSDTWCSAYTGVASEFASGMIAKVGAACGISQRVLLTLLQKEQRLVTRTDPTQSLLDTATGFSCSDTSDCEVEFAGFFKQLYGAAHRFRSYESGTAYRQGTTVAIRYNPDVACGSAKVTIWNKATSALYNYTPYQPNAEALLPANFFGDGDSCSAYGNRNFWSVYNGWFDSSSIGSVPTVTRISGQDRYDTAVAISLKTYPDGNVPVVYVAAGTNFPDALSAAPAAAALGGPLLLTLPDRLLDPVLAEVKRLNPVRIVVAGGFGSISESAFAQLSALIGQPNVRLNDVTRLNGIDRFETSRLIAQDAYTQLKALDPSKVEVAFVASGANFPDALSAGAVAGAIGAPVILVNGSADTVDAPTAALLHDLDVTKATVVGGPPSISASFSQSLAKLVPIVPISGSDRFDTNLKLNDSAPSTGDTVYLTTGFSFPDALAGAAAAGHGHDALYLAQTTCVPAHAVESILTRHVPVVYPLGGPTTLTNTVSQLISCQ
ncbi:cell wall-binding repeat-containing protein [Cryobacterium zhongshanensis]|uniref:Cell wall-binding repeat-containing protein n=1 Tax=Cryobacterium zhongshanensis TaxID=2928153 RepID=A0AA41QVB8_9MICO|nr:cell wall-binding repeat-containing protein [Cryobacterium zhongshanensis]MCI4658391.1 cell wall-binding repeat-containing protein [Cryobacterium zhongshanensis]